MQIINSICYINSVLIYAFRKLQRFVSVTISFSHENETCEPANMQDNLLLEFECFIIMPNPRVRDIEKRNK